MKLFCPFLSALALVEGDDVLNRNDFQTCPAIGGPHGMDFYDILGMDYGGKVKSISICHGHRVDGIVMSYVYPHGASIDRYHGRKKKCQSFDLAPDEYITHWEAHTVKADRKTKVCYVRFTNNKGVSFEGGHNTSNENNKAGCDAPEGYQLGGIFGREGDEIDALGPIWVKLDAPQSNPELDTIQHPL
ncbi:Mannose-binding lectin [Plasmopara halstedii]|uniref:Mannose-binding lectin n=1 Tax=Plasmopara halstedii TaxID=4781 RepID=A0A0P1AY61_PLAHL|nr:Mannose-binding lectin [Plasmopara halstedii]CEG47396.1 Mannose-binding lectin [Plasmopara halstedii]|eukprot:XP_024583765.1 Mannose-binding lectin [Plasmopara halstedii]